MNYTDWKQVRLVDLALINAKSISGKYPYEEIEYIDTSSVTGNEFSPLQRLKLIDAPSRAKRIVQHGDTILSTVRPIQRHFGFIRNPKPNTIASTGFAVITPKNINPEFLFYYLSQKSITNYLNGIAETSTTTFPAFRSEVLSDLEMVIPSNEKVQRRIAEILSALDDKIELNRQTNATLEAIAQTIFKEWFINFNFPGATGELVKSELGMIPKDWRVGKLEEIITNYDRKRVPLSSRERENRKGVFPYYGAASILDYVDDYLFDSVYLLMGEDGTVITEDGKPILQYVAGKFWVNNHTHVLQGNNPFSTEYVLLQLKNTNVKHIVTGAVQPKINQGNMNELPIVIPGEFTLLSFQDIITPIFKNILENEQETSILTGIRDNLLPKLMNGEIPV
jgi:type I restriction enzyme S subunit